MRYAIALLAACSSPAASIDARVPDAEDPDRVLVYTRTAGYRHGDSIDASNPVLTAGLAAHGVAVDFTEDPTAFTATNLARYRGVVFAYTTGNDIIEAEGKSALEAFVRGGGGWLGIHSASDTEYQWPFFQELVVAHALGHPQIQPATMHVEAGSHPVMAGVPATWTATDEWYNFAINPRQAGVQILATIDETTYTGGSMGADHPMIWCHERFGGRALYTQVVHVAARWQETVYVEHVIAAVRWIIRDL